MVVKDDHIVYIDLTATLIRAQVGLFEVIPAPTVHLSTRVGLRPSPSTSDPHPPRPSDYLVGPQVHEAERTHEPVILSWPFDPSDGDRTGNGSDQAINWTALEALFRHLLRTAIALPTHPYEHAFHVAYPPSLSHTSIERLAQLFFESLHVTSLLLTPRPTLQALACRTENALVLDIHPASTSLTAVLDGQTLVRSLTETPVGERDCDDYLAALLFSLNPSLAASLSPTSDSEPLAGRPLYEALISLVHYLKDESNVDESSAPYIKFVSPRLGLNVTSDSQTAAGLPQGGGANGEEEEEGITDIAKALMSGKANQIIANASANKSHKKGKGNAKSAAASAAAEDIVTVPHPDATAQAKGRDGVRIGKERHRYFEPLFEPSLLERTRKVFEKEPFAGVGVDGQTDEMEVEEQERPGMDEVRARYSQENIDSKADLATTASICATKVDRYLRGLVWESTVVSSDTEVSRMKGLVPAILTSFSPFLIDPAGSTAVHIPESQKAARHAKIPEYFPEYKEKPELAATLGAAIVGKIYFSDTAKPYLTKAEYSDRGPSIATRVALPSAA